MPSITAPRIIRAQPKVAMADRPTCQGQRPTLKIEIAIFVGKTGENPEKTTTLWRPGSDW